jgi:hypothetical protein
MALDAFNDWLDANDPEWADAAYTRNRSADRRQRIDRRVAQP